MILTQEARQLMHKYEGLRLEAYKCPAGVWTIGYGNTFYEDGTKVKQGDVITKDRAEELFNNIVKNKFEVKVKSVLSKELTPNKYSALVCFCYNVGFGNFMRSTLLKKVNANPDDQSISKEFVRWNKAGGRELLGLTRRRIEEAKLYFQ